jgi:peptidoglycan hydrolase-like protein with peptidoglycan-binding domain
VSAISPALSVGAFGDDAASLHGRLQSHGYDVSSAEVDRRFFGPGTRAVLQQFQTDHDLPATGVVDAATSAALAASPVAPAAGPVIASVAGRPIGAIGDVRPPGPQPNESRGGPPGGAPEGEKAIAEGARGDEVGGLHGTLRRLGYDVPAAEVSEALFGPGTRAAVRDAQRRFGMEATGIADETTLTALAASLAEHCGNRPPPPEKYVVHGAVRLARGGFLVGATVCAFDVDLRHEQPLGRPATTDGCGQYRIEYTPRDFRRSEVGQADLVVRAYASDGTILAESPTLFNAPADAQVDLVAGGAEYLGPSEYERVVARLLPALDQVAPKQLTLVDTQWLGRETGLPLDWIGAYALAAALAKSAGIAAEVFYALLREQLPFRGPSLLARPATALAAALDDAIARNIISDHPAEWRANAVAQLQQLAGEVLLGGDPAALGNLLTAAGVPAGAQRSFARAYLGQPVTTTELWANLTASLGAEAVTQLQTAMQWGVVTFNHPPLVAALTQTLGQPSDVARLSPAEWRQAIDQLATNGQPAVPARVQGATEDARRSLYAQQLHALAQSAFPTVALATHLQESTVAAGPGMRQFLEANPDWNIDTVPVRAYLDSHPVDAQTAASLAQLQRVHRVTAQPEWSVKLLEANFGSAQAISRAGLDELASATGATPAQAAALRERAGAIVDAAAVIHARFSGTYNRPALPAVPDMQQAAVQASPAYQDMFGPVPLCGCDECGSVLGASAYLVDLFQFLRTWSQAAWEQLFQRRPDLKGLQLSCTNTLTPLPLIDLVNELLEDTARQQPPAARQTTWTAADLAANPEHLAFDAYTPLAAATFPWTLPFDLALEEARAYLRHLGVSRLDVMRTLASTIAPDETTLATELLGMTTAEWAAIVTAAVVADGQPDPAWGNKSMTELASVELFLAHSGLHAADLPPLLSTRFVNPDTIPLADRVGLSIPDELCNPKTATIVNLHGDGMDRIRRFVRLQRRLGWTAAELDAALATIASGVLDGPGLVRLARFERLRRQTHLPVAELLTWWAPLDPRAGTSGRSQYDEVFVSRAGISTGTSPDGTASTPDPLALDASAQPQGAGAGSTLRTFLPRILAALGITAADAGALLAPDLPVSLDSPLSRENLSALYRALSLTRAASLSPADYGRLRRLCSPLTPFAGDIDSARRFLELAEAAAATALTLSEWAFLLRGEPVDGFAFDDASSTVFLTELRMALQTIDAGRTTSAADPDAVAVVRRKLAELVKGADLATVIAFLDQAPGTPPNLLPPPLTLLGLDAAAVTALTTSSASPPTDADIRARYELVRAPLLDYLALRDKTSLLIKRVAAAAGIMVELASALAQDPFGVPGGPALVRVLLAPAIVDPAVAIDPVTPALQPAYRGLRLFGKQALLAGRLRLATGELSTIQARQASLGWIDWTRLPAQDADVPLQWDAAAGLVQYVAIRDRLPRGRAPLWKVFALAGQPAPAGTTPADWQSQFFAELARRTGWEDVSATATAAPQLTALADALGLQRADFATVAPLARLAAAVALADHLGLPGATIGGPSGGWRAGVTPALAADIKGAARSKHPGDQWLSIAKALRDPLREQQRDALLAYLVGTLGVYADANQAFDTLLIDVETSACMLTSRIKQALSSTQLFIERCLLGAEGEALRLPAEAAWQWKWMRSYRVWEANRQVFLYPENWLRPELRTDKTNFFQELEDELHQKDLTASAAEAALRHYLEKLDAVARLEIVGFVTQPGAFASLDRSGTQDTSAVHVIGRTQAPPHSYHYRRLERGWRWTPWEPINADISGDHVMHMVWHGRLFVFWLQFHEKAKDQQQSPAINTGGSTVASAPLPPPPKQLEIQLAWTERKSDRWLPRRMSKDILIIEPGDQTQQQQSQLLRFSLNGYVTSDDAAALHVQCIFNGPLGRDEEPADHNCMVGEFVFGSCTQQPAVVPFSSVSSRNVTAPSRCDRDGVWFAETTGLSSQVDDPYEGWAACIIASAAGGDAAREFIKEQQDDDSLYLLRGRNTQNRDFTVTDPTVSTVVKVLAATPGQFTLSWPHDYAQFFSTPLFYWDQQRAFYVTTPSRMRAIAHGIAHRTAMSPGLINGTIQTYLPHQPIAPIAPVDPTPMLTPGMAVKPLALPRPMPSRRELERMPIVELLQMQHPAATGMVVATEDASSAPPEPLYRFFTHYHPYACTFLERLDRFGVDGFYAWNSDPVQQKLGELPVQELAWDEFSQTYRPVSPIVDPRYPRDEVEFSPCGAYAQYNWELFLHIPAYIAERMRTEQNHEEALRWLSFVFDPTTSDTSDPAPTRFWKMARLRRENAQNGDIVTLLHELAAGHDLSGSGDCEAETLAAQIREWRHDPFDPHAVARLRPTAYMRWVFNRYVQILIDWGDRYFRQNTLESINQAALRYVWAAELLGDRPDPIPLTKSASPVTYQQLLNGTYPLDAFSDELENIVPDASNAPEALRFPVSYGPSQVFCVPPNEQLFTLWDTVADRLFKIRHCMNIQGQVERLPLFEPPISPELLIAAQQAGVDLESAVNGVEAPVPRYRFGVVYERARELVSELRALGSALQAALEKRDAEDLALLRSAHEAALLTAVRTVRQAQVDESSQNLEALQSGRSALQTRVSYYQQKSQELANPAEFAGLGLMIASQVMHLVAQGLHLVSGVVGAVPQFKLGVAGVGGSPTATAEYGGTQIKQPPEKAAAALEAIGGALNLASSISTTIGGYQRRQQDITMQAQSGVDELAQLDKQILAAQIRQQITQTELDNHDLQIQQAGELDDFLRSKFTSRDLYDWMSGQLSALYLQTYQLAFDMARRAERAFRFELGLFDDQRTFIQFGYWDNLKQGLLAGERLGTDLARLHSAYLEENRRELELTKHVSLALTDPIALLALRQEGTCHITFNEQLFDLDMPGLYLRRIKSLALSIPCVSGTYTTVACKLTLLSDTVRVDPAPGGSHGPTGPNDKRFVTTSGGTQPIVTSTAQNDAGLFEVNLRDERYLPFEGAGVISQWKLELVPEAQQFDWATTSDVVLHLRYTARDGGEQLRNAAAKSLQQALQSGVRLFSTRSEFPDALAAFVNTPPNSPDQTLTIQLSDADFPFPVHGKQPKLGEWLVLVRWSDGTFGQLPLTLAAPQRAAGAPPQVTEVTPWPPSPAEPADTMAVDWAAQQISAAVQAFRCHDAGLGAWTLTAKASDLANLPPERLDANGHLNADQLDDVLLVVTYAS